MPFEPLYLILSEQHIQAAISLYKNLFKGSSAGSPDILYHGEGYVFNDLIQLAADNATGEKIQNREFDPATLQHINELLAKMGFTFVQKLTLIQTPADFTRQFYQYLENIPPKSYLENWLFDGKTDYAYTTPAGPWKRPGFGVGNNEYSFIIRSVWDAGNMLVVESHNLEGQLANVSLDNPDKFTSFNGLITIFETFDMTVGYGKKPRAVVKEIFERFGFTDNRITVFYADDLKWEKILLDILKWAITREKVKKYFQSDEYAATQNTVKDIPDANYWMLKIFGDNWFKQGINAGRNGYFGSSYKGVRRPDAEMMATIKAGDRGLAYDFSSRKGIAFLFEITQPLHMDANLGEIFNFTILETFDPYIHLDLFRDLLTYSASLDQETEQKLFPVDQQSFLHIVSLNKQEKIILPIKSPRPTYSEIMADSAAGDIMDQLAFTNDVNALAAVIQYKEVKPPLAIGLFGNWGSGKSFFMNKLQARINSLSEGDETIYCKNVLQINFNSWHYSDANLWASLVTKIFEDLEKYGKKRDKNGVEALFKNLHSAKEMQRENRIAKENLDMQIAALKKEQQILQAIISIESGKLSSLNFADILRGVKNSKVVRGEIEDLKKSYSFLNIEEFGDIDNNLQKLNDSAGKLTNTIKYAYAFRKGKIWIAVLAAVVVFLMVYFLLEAIPWFKKNIDLYKYGIAAVATMVTQFLVFLQPAIRFINAAYNKVKKIHELVEVLRKEAAQKFETDEKLAKLALEKARLASGRLQQEIDLLDVRTATLEQEINTITSGKKVISFIEGRVSDERYNNNLGIISWIRKDFEALDFLLKEQFNAGKLAVSGKQKVEQVFQLDRIILYIDDLDRCDVSIVVKVLEAIHLLLAFPLFVVIVGVDPRWMHHALTLKYKDLIAEEKSLTMAGSYDYLEKIFQIPFALRTMDGEGTNKLISAQFAEGKEPVTIPAPDSSYVSVPVSTGGTTVTTKTIITTNTGTGLSELSQIAKEDQESSLKVSLEEIAFMQSIAFLIGDSPRTLKRYINIYRIIRTHAQFETEGDEKAYYFAAMLLLAIITGMPDIAGHFIQLAKSLEQGGFTFKELLNKMLGQAFANIQRLYDLENKLTTDKILEPLSGMKLEKITRNLSLIIRFSFRNFT